MATPWTAVARPLLGSPDLLIGEATRVTLSSAPPEAELQLVASTEGVGSGPCDLLPDTCTTLLQPVVLQSATADSDGKAVFDVRIDPSQAPSPVYLEVLVYDPATGQGTQSNQLERHYTVPARQAAASFTEVTVQSGLTTTYTWSNTHTGGAAWVDYNGDLWPDLFITNGGGEPHYLYRNEGDGTFTDVSVLVPKPDEALEDAGVKFADFDNDGDSDILVVVDNPQLMDASGVNPPEGGPNLLYDNQGDGTFVETALAAGVVDPKGRRNSCGALGDYDLDGFVDVYLGVWAMGNGKYVHDNRLLHNDGDGTFSEVTDSPIQGEGLDTLVVQWFDADLDGRPDLYVANVAKDGGPRLRHDDFVYLSDGTSFYDGTPQSPGVGDDAAAAMGMDVGDIDNDGDFDIYITDGWGKSPQPTGGVLYQGNPDGTLSDNSCDVAGVCTGYHTWPANFADFDRDGWIDLRIGTTWPDKPDVLYINNGDGTFANHQVRAFTGNRAQGSAAADFDGDGDIDVFAQNRFMDSLLYANDGRDDNNWVQLKLIGTTSNRDAIGALVRLHAGGQQQIRRVSGTDSAHSQSELIVHFGVGSEQEARVDVHWPGGEVEPLGVVPINTLHVVREGDGVLAEWLTEGTLNHDRRSQTLEVVVRSGFGGRTQLTATGYGPLIYDAATTSHRGVFTEVDEDPGTITITSNRGGSWQIPLKSRGCGCAVGGQRGVLGGWLGLSWLLMLGWTRRRGPL